MVVELKGRDFLPEDVGQLNFYVSVVDDRLRKPQDEATIGLILCKGKNKVVAEYALDRIKKILGISNYDLEKLEALPGYIQGQLPTIQDIERELSDIEDMVES